MGWTMRRVLRLSEGVEVDDHGIVGRLGLRKLSSLIFFMLYLVF
jgi:hypothetical protein